MTTKNLELTETQAHALHQALLTESTRLADLADGAQELMGDNDVDSLLASCKRCRDANEYLRGRVAGLLEQF